MTRQNNYERVLPPGYVPRFTVDFQEKRSATLMNLACLVITIPLYILFWLLIRPWDSFQALLSISLLKLLAAMAALSAYIVLHELLHGAVYKLLTGHKLIFGVTWSAAYCGIPDIFVYRKSALMALLAPFAVFTLVFLSAALLLTDPVSKYMVCFLLATHIGGCVGDLYDTGLYLFRFRDPSTLMQDTGLKQTFFTKV